ncbi:MAG TPA: nucleoside kinase, partial [Candidatus Enterocola sp.]|nr:nucleoside kinase [Candidatus Enterocola sp.]
DVNSIKRSDLNILIKVTEALHEKKIVQIADKIAHNQNIRVILVAGPSSSGKTTFSKRLSVQLAASGIIPEALSLDNYFINRESTPIDENGEHDFESIHALDLPYLNSQLEQLINGKEVETPIYNFETGKREAKGKKMQIKDGQVLVIEGIHGLNPELTKTIPDETKFKIYVSALTTLSGNDHNWIPTSDTRILRRIIRDHKYRSYSAENTILRWPSVRRGENKWIFPYQENADAMFNSSLLFELSAIKKQAEPILMEVGQNSNAYPEARRLLNLLQFFTPISYNDIPATSLLREFLGGSGFRY